MRQLKDRPDTMLGDGIRRQLDSFREISELGRKLPELMQPPPALTALDSLKERFTLPTADLGHVLAAIAPPPLPEALRQQFEQLSASVTGALGVDAVKELQAQFQAMVGPLADAQALAGLRATEALGAAVSPSPAFDEAIRAATSNFPILDISWMDTVVSQGAAVAIERFQTRAVAMAEAPATTIEDVEALVSDAEAVAATAPAEARDSLNTWMIGVWLWLLGVALEDPAKEVMRQALAVIMLVLTGTVNTPPALPAVSPAPPLALPAPLPADGALTVPGGWEIEGLPGVIRRAGPQASRVTVEFFTAQIRNRNTRQAYAHAAMRFFTWCEERNLDLADITPFAVAAYIEELKREASAPTVKQHLAAIRTLFDWLVVKQVIGVNPAASVRGPSHVVKRGKTPVLTADQARTLLDSIDVAGVVGLRDRALIGVMVYSFARVSAAVGMNVEDYFPSGKRWWFRLHEKGGKRHEVPAHHNAEAYLDAYLEAAGLGADRKAPLFRSARGRSGTLTDTRLHRLDVLRMIYRRAKGAGLEVHACCHTFRATGITAYLENGGTIEKAQQIAAHESPRTTKLYDRTSDELTLDEIERIVI